MMKEKDLKQRVLGYVQEADEDLLLLIEELAETYTQQRKEDWWDKLSANEKASIRRGLEDADKDKVVPHNEVMRLFEKWH